MLNAPDLEFQDVLAAVEAWQPDAACLAAGDEYVALALRCYAAAGLCDAQIICRVLDHLGSDVRRNLAAGIAYHCAISGMTFSEIIDVMVDLAVEVPGWIDDPDEIKFLVRSAIAECEA